MKDKLFSLTQKDFEWDYERGSGKGGQKKNKTCSAVRCRHLESGAMGWSEDTRSQSSNKITSFKRCVKSKEFQIWLKIQISKTNSDLNDKIDDLMQEKNISVEVRNNNKWVKDD